MIIFLKCYDITVNIIYINTFKKYNYNIDTVTLLINIIKKMLQQIINLVLAKLLSKIYYISKKMLVQ